MVAALGLGVLSAAVLFVGFPAFAPVPPVLPPAVATPLPWPTVDPLARALLVAQATWYAPTPARPTAVPRPTSTPVEAVLCGVNAAAGEVCHWPDAPAPTPTPVPGCGTPLPGAVCVWGGGR